MDTGSNGTLVYRASSTVRTEAWRSGVSQADLTYSARVEITGANSASTNAGLIFRSAGSPALAGGATLQVYLDGALLATVTDASLSSGHIRTEARLRNRQL